jgi:uracil phosphoribosyltransferase
MVNIISHPLVANKLSLMRDKNTRTKEFRELTYEISQMIGYEAMRKLKTKMVKIETPITTAMVPALNDTKLALVPILRAGIAMSDAISSLVPTAKIGHIGMYRHHVTHEAIEYFCKLPVDISECEVFMLDPMLATGASALAAINLLKQRGAKNIVFVCILASPIGVTLLQESHPDVDIYTAAIDDKLDENCYIIPGLGDAGDRIFGTL